MASWLERGRPAIFEALQKVCDSIDSDLASELQERDQKQHAFLSTEVDRLRSRLITFDKLEQENRALRNEVTALRNQITSASSALDKPQDPLVGHGPVRHPLGEISTNTASRLVALKVNHKEAINQESNASASAEFADLQERHARLISQCQSIRRAKDAIEARAHKLLADKDQWKKYAEALEAKLEKQKRKHRHGPASQPRSTTELANPHPGLEASRTETSPAEASSISTSKATLGSSLVTQTSASVSFSGFETALLTDVSQRRAVSTPADPARTGTGEETTNSTQDDDDDVEEESLELPQLPANNTDSPITVIKSEPSSDIPVIVAERRVGKRKRVDNTPHELSSRTPQRVKTEDQSSDPLVMGESHHFSPQESLDLDTDGGLLTPKMIERRMQSASGRIKLANANIHGQSRIFDLGGARPAISPIDAVQDRPASVRDLHVFPSPTNHSVSKTPGARRKDSGELALGHAVASLAEDGLDPTGAGRRAKNTDQPTAPTLRASRLESLLNNSSPSPQDAVALLRPNRHTREASRPSLWLTDTPVRILPFGKEAGTNVNSPATTKSKTGSEHSPAPPSAKTASRLQAPKAAIPGGPKPTPQVSRLRDRPLASLRLEDFKINPRFNNGQDFAYTEVVRNKAERADLPGCTDPECCGKHFRAMAQSELEAAGPSLIHRPSDIKLLEDYLGDQAYKLGSMIRQEKEKLWLEAKTRELANKHGKHRHRFARRQSPPGFWNADFPTSQEMQREREEGELREKRMIEERWREAMRDGTGGRWLFRDE